MNTKILSFLFSLIFFAPFSHAQIVINEVSSNQATYADNDGDHSDWIELYNGGASPVNLLNYKLSDDPLLPAKWTFPSVSIPAGGYLTVFASNKDKVDFVDHWEMIVRDNDAWKYIVPGSGTATSWRDLTFNDAAWTTGTGSIGYGGIGETTTVAGGTESVFMRRTFNVVDSNLIKEMILNVDYDDGFVAYLNGVEIARDKVTGNPPAYNAAATTAFNSGGTPVEFVVNPSIFKPLLRNGNNVLSIQVHNVSSSSSDLLMRAFLMVGIGSVSTDYFPVPGWFTPPSAGAAYLHTNFAVSSGGETVVLSDASNTIINSIAVPALALDNTYGRYPNGSGTLSLLSPATPSASNNSSTAYTGYLDATVTMSVPPGFYSGTQSVSCTCSDPTAQIRYTQDGSKPVPGSSLYSGAISVSSTRVLRAMCYKAGYISRNIETNTYFINDAGTTLAVFSISTHPNNFFHADTGMYVMGPNASGANPHYGANFWQDWEREVHIEYFDKSKVNRFEQDCGIKIFGGWSRAHAMKSMRLIPNSKYGVNKIYYPLFSERPNINVFDQVHLRNGGNDFNQTHLRDQVNHRVLQTQQQVLGNKTHIDFSAYEPVAVFINGSYWGVHHLRERYNHGYFESHHGYAQGEFEMLEMDGDVIKADNTHFLNMLNFIQNNSMSNAANYNTVKGWLDIENYVDYFIAETYHTNKDWPNNNIKYWRALPDGKWRYLYYDTDFSFNMFSDSPPTLNELNNVINSLGGFDRTVDNPHSPMFKKLLDNTEFRNYFINRYADLINTIYQPSNYKATFDALKNELNPEMSRHFSKWPYHSYDVSGWNSQCSAVRTWMDDRPPYARNHIQSQFSLAGQVNVTLQASPAGAGVIKISTIVPQTLPWTGVYFNGVPVTIQAIANPGYTFANWTSSSVAVGTPTNSTITLNISANNTFTANFTTTTNIPRITISEINYNTDPAHDADEWIELHNYGNASMNLSGWKIKDGNDFNSYVIPNGTTLAAGQYLVIVKDVAKFTALHPGVTNYIGPFDFSLNNDGENIRLFDNIDRVYLSMTYNDVSPWPLIADGQGATLELIDPDEDLSDGTNWYNGCRGGSPGTAYVECPCAAVDLGPDRVLCSSGGSVVLNSGLAAHPNRTFKWYFNGTLLPLTNPSMSASAAGNYSLVVDSLGCIKTDDITLTSNLSVSLGPDVTLCNPITTTLNTGLSGAGINYVWRRNGTVITGQTGPSLYVSSAGTYQVSVSATGCTTQSDDVVVTSNAATPVDASRCGPGTVTLGITGPGSYEWYANPTGGSSLFAGASFTTPSISTTTTYYVKDASYIGGTLGPANPSVVGGSVWTNEKFDVEENGKLIFDVLQPIYLNAITVYADGPQDVTVRVLQPNKTTVRFTRTVTVTAAGLNRIPLDFQFTAADVKNGYYLDLAGTTGMLDMNGNGGSPSYPYTAAGYMRITGTDPSWAGGQGWYFFAYNWEYSNSATGVCERVPVTATVNPPLGALGAITGNFNVCSGTSEVYSVPLLAGATTYTWTVPDGSVITGGQGTNTITVNIGSTSGTISVTPSSSCGNGSASNQALTVSGSGLAASVNIAITTGSNPSCFGNSVTFTATPTNGGASPIYQWNRNGNPISGAMSSIYTTSSLVTGDEITCTLTSNATCVTTATATSSPITMTVNSAVIPSVDIALTTGSNPTCAGNSVTFTATPTNGGTTPSYQWRRNGSNISGATNQTYATTTLVNGDIITCRITSNAACASPLTATSTGITMTVNPTVVPTAGISLTSGSNPTCAGSSVTFTATGTNVGASPVYQWRKNASPISGEDASTYTTTDLVSGDVITCAITSSAVCASPVTVVSSGITMTVTPVAVPSVNVSISGGSNPTCSGASVTFTASPVNGGTTPSYQWNKNGSPVSGELNATYTASDLADGDIITCTLTSNAACASPLTATSTGITMTVTPSVTPSVLTAITTGSNPSCSGSSVTFTATPTNGGVSPTFQWNRNGIPVSGATNSTYSTTSLADGDVITCTLTSNATCASPLTATSTDIIMTVTPTVTPSVITAITAGSNPVCAGTSVTFTATPSNGGSSPIYQWRRNGSDISGATDPTYSTSTLVNGDVITCRITSNATCASPLTATSTGITMTVTPVAVPSVNVSISGGSNPTCSGASVTFTASPVNGGTTPSYQWNKNGSPVSGELNATYTASDLADGDIITCTLTSNAACASPLTATSTGITISVNSTVAPQVNIALTGGTNPTCSGTALTFTATPVNGGGAPTYQWNKNGNPVLGEESSTYTATDLVDTDEITCTMTSNLACASPATATSTGINITVDAVVVPSVSIALTSGSNPSCSGSAVTFTATPTNGGAVPTYQWNKNGGPVSGEINSTYTATDLADTDIITCTMTSDLACASPATATSSGIVMVVNGTVTPSVSIALSAGTNPTCSGSSVTFTASPVNGGTSPGYQWNKNGSPVSGEIADTYSASDLVNGDVITCTLTSNATCVSSAFATSSGITMTINGTINPSVGISISSGSNPVCSGGAVTFTATPIDGGSTPSYQWNKNGSPVTGEESSDYTASDLINGDVITCTMTSSLACASPVSTTSSGITMTVNAIVVPTVSISISSGANPSCSGSSVTFTAAPVNGGSIPTYQWNKNGGPVTGETGITYTASDLANGDVITCTMTSNAACASPATATSAGTTMTIMPTVAPSVTASISSGSNPACLGSSVTFTAVPANGGTTPTYQWNINSVPVSGETNSTYTTSALTNGDIVTCTIVSNEACLSSSTATSTGINMTITPSVAPSATIAISSGSNPSCSGSLVTFTATPIDGGATPSYQWNKNGSPIPGEEGASYSATDLVSGDVVTCTVTSSLACASPSAVTSSGITMTVNAPLVPSVSIAISSGSNPVCTGSSVGFTATPVNGGGTPLYQWNVNASPISGENASTYTSSSLVNGDVITCTITSSASCVSSSTATSSGITMTIDALPTIADAGPDQNITSSTTFLDANVPVVGTGEWTAIQGGGFILEEDDPKTSVGALSVGANIYQWTITNGSCPPSSDQVTVNVGVTPPFVITGPDNVTSGQTYTFSVPDESGASFIWAIPSGATIVSGNGTNTITVTFGANTSGTISVTKFAASGNQSASKNVGSVTAIAGPGAADSYMVYPNPFFEDTRLVITSSAIHRVQIKVMDMRGITVYQSDKHFTNENIELGEEFPQGVYVIHAGYDDRFVTFKVIKTE